MKVTVFMEDYIPNPEYGWFAGLVMRAVGNKHASCCIEHDYDPGYVIAVDPTWHRTGIGHMDKEEFWRALNSSGVEFEHVTIEVGQDDQKGHTSCFEPITCVTSIKRICGIHNWYIWTPKQLMKNLRKREWHQ